VGIWIIERDNFLTGRKLGCRIKKYQIPTKFDREIEKMRVHLMNPIRFKGHEFCEPLRTSFRAVLEFSRVIKTGRLKRALEVNV